MLFQTHGEASLKVWEAIIKTEKDLAGKDPEEIINKKSQMEQNRHTFEKGISLGNQSHYLSNKLEGVNRRLY